MSLPSGDRSGSYSSSGPSVSRTGSSAARSYTNTSVLPGDVSVEKATTPRRLARSIGGADGLDDGVGVGEAGGAKEIVGGVAHPTADATSAHDARTHTRDARTRAE